MNPEDDHPNCNEPYFRIFIFIEAFVHKPMNTIS